MKRIEVVRESDSRLKRDVWTFWYYDRRHTLVLDEFVAQARATRRHGYKTGTGWSRLYERRSTLSHPPLPRDVADEAMAQFYNTLVVEPAPND